MVKITYADGSVQHVRQHVLSNARTKRGRYKASLQSKHWQALRLRALRRDGFRCTRCRSTDHLEVHHLTYERLGTERLADVQT